MLKEMLAFLQPKAHGVYVDGTFGRGGYTKAILETEETKVVAIDRDAQAIEEGQRLQKNYAGRLQLIEGRFGQMDRLLKAQGVDSVDGVALDIGVSSPQLDDAARGFSFRHDGPLDMRMGQSGASAADIVNSYAEDDLANILYVYGEERFSRRVAKAIISARATAPITRTQALAEIVRSVVPRSKDGIDPATRSFQGLRIAVNEELEELKGGILAATRILKTGGRLVVISFHSLEDRIVKTMLREGSARKAILSRHMPMPANQSKPVWRVLTTKPARARADEVAENPRATSACLRAAERLPQISENGIACEDSNASEIKGEC
jgi:16S rRNA (cytosine1402-N4)-methyltransferase